MHIPLDQLRSQITATCIDCGRDPSEITLVAVSKTRTSTEINELIQAGITTIGENRVQEAAAKFPDLLPCERHFIGHAQTNKAREIVALFDCVQSIDSVRLAEKLEKECAHINKKLPIFVQVNIAREENKSGFREDELPAAIENMQAMAHLQLVGIMVIGPHTEDKEIILQVFQRGKELMETFNLPCYSAGMSHDWPLAICAGATHLRIGTSLFGALKK